MAVGARPDADHISELFSAFGPVTVRRMFGGAGVYADGMMVALVADGVIYLKTNEATRAGFEREGCRPFQYDTRRGRQTMISFWRMPERLYDDPDELAQWARDALAVARVGGVTRKRPKSKKRG